MSPHLQQWLTIIVGIPIMVTLFVVTFTTPETEDDRHRRAMEALTRAVARSRELNKEE